MRPVARAAGLPALLLSAAGALAQAPSPAPTPPRPRFAAGVDVVRLDVYASHGGQPLAGLTAGDFEVLDDGVPQRVELESAGGPVHAILLLDTSASVAGERLRHLQAAARAFADGLGEADRATLLTFSHDVRLASPPSFDRAALRRALAAVEAGGGTALHDALFAALQFGLPEHGRGVVLAFTDGDDRLSWLDANTLRRAARRAEATVHAVTLDATEAGATAVAAVAAPTGGHSLPTLFSGPDQQPTGGFRAGATTRRRETPALLRDLAADTGGQVWRAEDGARLRDAFLGVLAEVKSRYLLRFEPTGARPGWHDLTVGLKGRRGEVRTRKGYVAAGGGAPERGRGRPGQG